MIFHCMVCRENFKRETFVKIIETEKMVLVYCPVCRPDTEERLNNGEFGFNKKPINFRGINDDGCNWPCCFL